jgi:hypothetical protein
MLEFKVFDDYLEIHAGKMDYIKELRFEGETENINLSVYDTRIRGYNKIENGLFKKAADKGIEINPNDPLAARYPNGGFVFENVYDNDLDYLYPALEEHGYVIKDSGNDGVYRDGEFQLALCVGLNDAPAFAYQGKVYAFMDYQVMFLTDAIYRHGYARLEFARNFDREDLESVCDFFGYDINEELENGVITIEQPLPMDDLPFKEVING